MNIVLIIAFSIVIGTLSLTLFYFSYYYLKLHGKYDEVFKQNLYLKHHISEKGLEKLNNARDQSNKIVSDAIVQAEEIINKAELLKDDANKDLAKELLALSNKQKEALSVSAKELHASFTDAIEHLTNDDINTFQNITKDIENVAVNEIQKFEKQLHDETIGGQNIVEQQIQDAFAKANFEIEEYKKDKIEKADREVFNLLQKIVKEVMHKQISYDDHKNLIMAALNDAKKEMI